MSGRVPTHPGLSAPLGAPYYFTVNLMAPNPRVDETYTPGSDWQPPREMGGNIRYPVTDTFRFDGRRATTIERLPINLRTFQTYSIYHCSGNFWIVPCDATERAVAGVDRGSSSDSNGERDDHQEDDWGRIMFSRQDTQFTAKMSYAGYRQEDRRLIAQRNDQIWPSQLLPDGLQARPARRADTGIREGGLVGDLSLLIGLMVMSLPMDRLDRVPAILPTMMNYPENRVGHFNVHPPERIPRSLGWIDKRGLVVKVYHREVECPAEKLKRFQNGHFGVIFF